MVTAQEDLNKKYPDKAQAEAIYLSDLKSNQPSRLIISDYPNLKLISGLYDSNLTHLTIQNCPQLEEIRIIQSKNLLQLTLNNLPNLNWLDCTYNNLTTLDLSCCVNLARIYCLHNQLTQIKLPQGEKLEELWLNDNNLHQDLSFLRSLVNLKDLDLSNNPLHGSLEYLKGLGELEKLDIQDTDLESGLEHLPDSLQDFYCSVKYRSDAKVKAIYNLFADEQGKVETDRYGNITNFSQKLQTYKQRETLNYPEEKINLKKLSNQMPRIPHEKFSNIKHLADGGFSKVYKAKLNNQTVVLKSLNDSQGLTANFLQEISYHKIVESNLGENQIVKCLGISQDPQTKNYLMVMEYVYGGNLREYLSYNYDWLSFHDKLFQLQTIAKGLSFIHKHGLTHQDLHSGNILIKRESGSYITDLGLCRPVNAKIQEKKYGVLPYVAPEILNNKPYTKEADIYSFGIVAYELLANAYPYPDLKNLYPKLEEHKELELAFIFNVCDGLRPNLNDIKIPQLLKNLIKDCWDADPKKRPTASRLEEILWGWKNETDEEEATEFYYQYKKIEKTYNKFSQGTEYKSHPTAIVSSKLINTKESIQRLKSLPTEDSREFDLDISAEEFNQLNLAEIKADQQKAQILQPTNLPGPSNK